MSFFHYYFLAKTLNATKEEKERMARDVKDAVFLMFVGTYFTVCITWVVYLLTK